MKLKLKWFCRECRSSHIEITIGCGPDGRLRQREMCQACGELVEFNYDDLSVGREGFNHE